MSDFDLEMYLSDLYSHGDCVANYTKPPSLAVSPNIDVRDQTVDQLKAEYCYWERKLAMTPRWGAAAGAARDFRDSCSRELKRRGEAAA